MLRAQVRIPIPTYLSLSLEFLFNLPSTFKKNNLHGEGSNAQELKYK